MFLFRKAVTDKFIYRYKRVVEYVEGCIELWKNETMAVRITVQ